MLMARKLLLDKLLTVSPALANHDLLPALTHFWFTGKMVMAFNDQIAISVPLQSDFVGAVAGNVLLDLLKNSKARDVELAGDKDVLNIKAASSRLKLASLPKSAFLFDMPEPPKVALEVNAKLFLNGIESCLRSVGTDTSVPDQLGVTMLVGAQVLDLYSTNNSSLSHARVQMTKTPKFKRVVLPTAFCKQMLALTDRTKPLLLAVQEDHAMLDAGGGRCLFGRLIDTDGRVDFPRILAEHLPTSANKQMVPMPDKLQLVLERASIIAETATADAYTTITVENGKTGGRIMRFHSKSDKGEVRDSVQIAEQHPNVTLKIEPKALKAGYDPDNKLLLTERCAVMASGKNNSMIYLVAARG